jgi:nucleotide-binding universal stress UspA family protein
MEQSVLSLACVTTIRSVLCPIDFSEASRTALREAVRVVRQFKASLHVVFVEDPLLATAAMLGPPALPDLKAEVKQFIIDTPDLDVPADPVLHVLAGHPAEEIVRLADHEHADLIVIGMHGLTGVAKAFFGSTTARVLRRARTPLWIVPATDGSNKARDLSGLGSVLVLCDFGSSAACAARTGACLAETVGARLVLVHVTPSVSAPASWSARVEAAMEQRTAEAHHRICGAMSPLEQHGPVESVIVHGSIARRVAELARTHHAGLIVIGLETDARGPCPGSTAYAVISGAAVPVLTVPVPTTESDASLIQGDVVAMARQ